MLAADIMLIPVMLVKRAATHLARRACARRRKANPRLRSPQDRVSLHAQDEQRKGLTLLWI